MAQWTHVTAAIRFDYGPMNTYVLSPESDERGPEGTMEEALAILRPIWGRGMGKDEVRDGHACQDLSIGWSTEDHRGPIVTISGDLRHFDDAELVRDWIVGKVNESLNGRDFGELGIREGVILVEVEYQKQVVYVLDGKYTPDDPDYRQMCVVTHTHEFPRKEY